MAIERQDDQQIFQMIGSAQVASAATSCGCCSYSDANASEPGLFFFRERPWVVTNGWLCWDHCSNGYQPSLGVSPVCPVGGLTITTVHLGM